MMTHRNILGPARIILTSLCVSAAYSAAQEDNSVAEVSSASDGVPHVEDASSWCRTPAEAEVSLAYLPAGVCCDIARIYLGMVADGTQNAIFQDADFRTALCQNVHCGRQFADGLLENNKDGRHVSSLRQVLAWWMTHVQPQELCADNVVLNLFDECDVIEGKPGRLEPMVPFFARPVRRFVGWRQLVFYTLHSLQHKYDELHDFYVFGVMAGAGMRELFQKSSLEKRPTFVFDSFQGMPDYDGIKSEETHVWKAGEYAYPHKEKLEQEFPHATFIKGFYNETLPLFDPKDHHEAGYDKGAAFVDIDVDYATSTTEALEFLMKNNLLRVGTVIAYDDWWTVGCVFNKDPTEFGNGLAHKQFAEKYGIYFQCVGGLCSESCSQLKDPIRGVLFVVKALHQPDFHTGFDFGADSLSTWLANSEVCSDAREPPNTDVEGAVEISSETTIIA